MRSFSPLLGVDLAPEFHPFLHEFDHLSFEHFIPASFYVAKEFNDL
jgi:hypothetical protein